MIKHILASTLIILSLAACNKTEAKAGLGEWTEVPYGEEVTFTNGPAIKFVELETDSRCAIGVTCVWEGEAKAQIAFEDANKATTHILTERGSAETTEAIRGYKVDFNVSPYPKAGQEVPKEDYVLKVRVDKDTPVSSDDATTVPTITVPGTPKPTATTFPTSRAKAPIDRAEIAIAKSLPPQYSVEITSGLPSGCAKFDGYDVKREGELITITVWNTMPAPGAEIACTMIYGMKDTSVYLGSDFETGKTYTVMINDETRTFVAQ